VATLGTLPDGPIRYFCSRPWRSACSSPCDRRRRYAGGHFAAQLFHRRGRRDHRFRINSTLLIICGALVGASGTILTVAMSRAMNRPLTNVLFGAFGSAGRNGARRG